MYRITVLVCLVWTIVALPVGGQIGSRLVHYSEEDGLPQNRISSIFQDSRGFVWLATPNGVAKFDGYKFTSYLNVSTGSCRVRDSRIIRIAEDRSGRMWFIAYNGDVHRLDPATDSLADMTSRFGEEGGPFRASRINVAPSGRIWLISDEDGCVEVRENSSACERYDTGNGRLCGNRISYVHEDSAGNTWILTDSGLALVRPDEAEPTLFFNGSAMPKHAFHAVLEVEDRLLFGADSGSILSYSKTDRRFESIDTRIRSSILHLIRGKERQVIIGTENDGILIRDFATGRTEHYDSRNSALAGNRIYSLFLDPYENVWIQLSVSGITRFDLNEKTFTRYYPPSDGSPYDNASQVIRTDSQNRLWMRPRNGEFSYYDPGSKRLIPFHATAFSPSPDYSSKIYSICFDRQNNLWLSPSEKGLDKITFSKSDFRLRAFASETNSSKNTVRAILEDAKSNTWFATKDGKIHVFDSAGRYTGHLCADGTVGSGTPIRGMTYCLHQDGTGDIWIGTRGDGIYRLTSAGRGYRIEVFKNDPNDPYSLNSDHVFSIRSDAEGRVWIGTWGGGVNLFKEKADGSAVFIHCRNRLIGYPKERASFVRYISAEKNGKIYVATNSGLLVFGSDYESEEQIFFRHYGQGDGPEGAITKGDIHHVLLASSGVYLSTAGGGINYVREWGPDGFPAGFGSYTRKDGLASDNVLSVLEVADSSLWVFSEESVTRFDPRTGYFKTFGSADRMLEPGLFQEGASVLTRSRKILQGSSEGIFSFDPLELPASSFVPRIVFTGFRLFNKELSVGEKTFYRRHIDDLDKLILSHKDRTFGIEFAALDFNGPENIRYAYMLEGFDTEWIYSEKQRVAGYMNLPKGVYRLRVKSTNADGTWVANERQLVIEVLPSFWQTGWAYFLYVLFLLLLVLVVAYILYTIYRLKNRVRMETQLTEMKLRFFTDISHEIRTPLTLITAPVDHLLHDETTPPAIRKQLGYVAENTRRMLRMVNQVLDFRKAQNGRLKIEPFAAGELIGTVCRNFEGMAGEKQIDFTYTDNTGGALIWADRDGVEKILFNLLSNAFKYTPSGKNIRVVLKHDAGHGFTLEVADEGKGIASEEQPFVFNRFFNVKSEGVSASSGIGLSLVKELVDKHGAEIRMESVSGAGTALAVFFKDGYAHYGNDVDRIVSSPVEMPKTREDADPEFPVRFEPVSDKPTVLVAEDAADLRTFIGSILASEYQVLSADNGKTAYDLAVRHIPDFIVSDVMMPEMDGIALLKSLRTNLNTSHIPVILLTAKDAIEDRLKGLETGADDYIVKPFSVPYFRARIRNLLQQRKHLHDLYCSSALLSHLKYDRSALKNMAELDREFLDRVMRQIESHLDDSDYSIDALAKTAGINRTAFFKKVKSLTGMAPVEFIRDVRLRNAARLLKTTRLMVKEVAYAVGFTDMKYFTQCFKSRYKKTPAQYRDSV